MIGENIARLRKERSMTQENLAEAIGVSVQTISKWENSTTYPDVTLLPVIADIFGVTVDALYGREAACRNIRPEGALDAALEQVRRTIVGCFYHEGERASFEQQVEEHRQALKNGELASVIENDAGGVIYMREPVGALLLRRPEEGWNSLFTSEGNLSFLRLMTDEDFRRAMAVILKKRMLTFTLPALMRMAEIEDGENLERCLQESRAFARKTLAIDGDVLNYYEVSGGENRLYMMFAVLAYAQEYVDYRNKHCYFMGNMNYFTP